MAVNDPLIDNEFNENQEKYMGKEDDDYAVTIKELRLSDPVKIKNGPNRGIVSEIDKKKAVLKVICIDQSKVVEQEFDFKKESFKVINYDSEDSPKACLRTARNCLQNPESAELFNNNEYAFAYYCKTKVKKRFDLEKHYFTMEQKNVLKDFWLEYSKTGNPITTGLWLATYSTLLASPFAGIFIWLKENKGYQDYSDIIELLHDIGEITKDERDFYLRKKKFLGRGRSIGTLVGGIGLGCVGACLGFVTFGPCGLIALSVIGGGFGSLAGHWTGEHLANKVYESKDLAFKEVCEQKMKEMKNSNSEIANFFSSLQEGSRVHINL